MVAAGTPLTASTSVPTGKRSAAVRSRVTIIRPSSQRKSKGMRGVLPNTAAATARGWLFGLG